MRPGESGMVLKDIVNALVGGKRFQNEVDHDTCAFEAGIPAADVPVHGDVIGDMQTHDLSISAPTMGVNGRHLGGARMNILAVLLAASWIPSSYAVEFEFTDKITVTNAATFKGTATVQGSAFSVGGSTLVVVVGQVGIGTTGPVSMLHASKTGGGNGGRGLTLQQTDPSSEIGIEFRTGSAGGAVHSGITQTQGAEGLVLATFPTAPSGQKDIRFKPNDTFAVAITSQGNVGIGTTSPTARLEVNGVIQIGGAVGAPGTTGVYVGALIDGCGGGCSRLADGYLGWDDTTDTFQGADVIGKDDAFDATCYLHAVDNIYCGALPIGDRYPIIFSVKFN